MKTPAFTFADLDDRLRYTPLWKLGIKGSDITVAVLDTGVNSEADLEGAVVIDKDFTGENNPRDRENEHGTSVAQAIHIIAPKAHVANLKVIPQNRHPDRETVCKGIQFCIDQYPLYRVINLSVYFYPEGCSKNKRCALCSMVNNAVSKGIVVVAAAGNLGPGTITCPGLAERAITVVSTWTKKESEWWENSSMLKKWWWKISGELGKAYGTSYSAAWASGGVALLLSALKEATPDEIRQAVMESSFKIPKAPETEGIMQCEEAFDLLLSEPRYARAKRALYSNLGNELAQKSGSPYISRALALALSFIEYKLIKQQQYAKAADELNEIQSYLVPGALPLYEQKINQLLIQCSTS